MLIGLGYGRHALVTAVLRDLSAGCARKLFQYSSLSNRYGCTFLEFRGRREDVEERASGWLEESGRRVGAGRVGERQATWEIAP